MKEYLYSYIEEMDMILKSDKSKEDLKIIKEEHLNKINFFQHERLIHLIITLFYALAFIIFVILGTIFAGFYLISLILMFFVIFYIIHYFNLENGVQYLYKQNDLLNQKINEEEKANLSEIIIEKLFAKIIEKIME